MGREVLTKPVFFVGFMGAGKTSLARKLSRLCGAMSFDADVYLSRYVGMQSADYIKTYGEPSFRQLELEALRELMQKEPSFISLGGGVVENEQCRDLLKNNGYVIYMKVTALEAASRISNIKTRPLFGNLTNAQALNESREPLYASVADYTYLTADQGLSTVAHDIRMHLLQVGVLEKVE